MITSPSLPSLLSPCLTLLILAGPGGGPSSRSPEVGADAAACVEEATRVALPDVVPEASGIAIGRRDGSVLWIHNDSGGEPAVYAVSEAGALLGHVRVRGAGNTDWEDMAIAACGQGSCLYLADIGDNEETRPEIVVYRVPEPARDAAETAEAAVFRMRYPDGPRDAEAMFVMPGETLYVVSKGRSDAAALYRYPGTLDSDEIVTLERVRAMTDQQPSLPDQITGAAASPDGSLIALRSYTVLYIYGTEDGLLTQRPLLSQRLRTLDEPQGEAVDLGEAGLVVLASEAGRASTASMSRIRCEVSH